MHRRTAFIMAIASLVVGLMEIGETSAGQLGPERVVSALKGQLSENYTFVIGFTGDIDHNLLPASANATVDIALLHAIAANLKVEDAFALSRQASVDWVWYLHPDEAGITVRALQGIDYAVKTLEVPNLINLSIGPPTTFYRIEEEKDAPFSRAIRAAAEKGFITVVAIGNTGAAAPGYVNPWSLPDEVISVGAWDHQTDTVWTGSSTGLADHPAAWPDVIAPGVDVIGPWTTARDKPADRRAYDEGNAHFRASVPREKWDQYTMMTGTSQAAAVVSGAAAQVLRYLKGFIAEHHRKPGDKLFSLEAGPERISDYQRTAARVTGTAVPSAGGGMIYEYTLDAPWKLVKQILIDTAIPVKGAEPWQAGAGRVDPDYIRAQFGAYGIEPPQIVPVKIK